MAQKKSFIHSGLGKALLATVGVVLLLIAISIGYIHYSQQTSLSFLQSKISELTALQNDNNLSTVNMTELNNSYNQASQHVKEFDLIAAGEEIAKLKTSTTSAAEKITEAITAYHNTEAAQAALAAQRTKTLSESTAHRQVNNGKTVELPVIMYHKPPADFEQQMVVLKEKGYTTVHMSQVADFFAGRGTLPPKPAVVTFDDAFYAQLAALPILQKYNTKATLYLIVGGEMSHYCIGLLRTNITCGDAYLTVANAKFMQASGLIEIGDHTIDHPNMASLSEADQSFQINTSKQFLEQNFNVPINTFAYPYGTYNATTVKLLAQAGFTTAVTTQPGLMQSAAEALLMHRVRSTYILP